MNTISIFQPAALTGSRGKLTILEEVRARAWIDDLFAKVEIEQRYRNTEATDIEAVYTFPVAMDAVLLGFELEINDHTISGTVMKKQESEEKYEDAIDRGDSAGLLEKISPGLYSVSIGNLRPGETATIRYRYGQFLRWNGDRVRFTMPTTIAPRYGSPEKAGLKPHQTPEYTFDAERSFHLEILVRGVLQNARLSSPSHDLCIEQLRGETLVTLGGVPKLDRDAVLEARTQKTDVAGALVAPDENGWVALASFRPEFPKDTKLAPRAVLIVVDCSGSMSGDSITQAREALERILDNLREGDVFDIIAFGSNHHALFDGSVQAVSPSSLAKARTYVRQLGANMGGTETGRALEAAYHTRKIEKLPKDLLLITDGHIWDNGIRERAKESGFRIFPIGIGVASAESALSTLAEATRGACEFVSPRENIAERIHRHFQRMYTALADSVSVHWSATPRQCLPDTPRIVYDGDTLHIFAWFDQKPSGAARLEISVAGGQTFSQEAPLQEFYCDRAGEVANNGRPPGTLARMAAADRIAKASEAEENQAIAIKYQLVSPWTNYIVEHLREAGQKADGQPALCKVPQQIAAGWHGLGSVHTLAYQARDIGFRASGRSALHNTRISNPSTMHYISRIPELRSRASLHQSDHSNDRPEPWQLNQFNQDTLSLVAWQLVLHKLAKTGTRLSYYDFRRILVTAIKGEPLPRGDLADVAAPGMCMEWITRVLHQPLLVHPDSGLIKRFWMHLSMGNLPAEGNIQRKSGGHTEAIVVATAKLLAWNELIAQGCTLRFAVLVHDKATAEYLLLELDTAVDPEPDQCTWELDRIGYVMTGTDGNGIRRFSWSDPWDQFKIGLLVPSTAHLLRLDDNAMKGGAEFLESGGKTGACPVWEKIELAPLSDQKSQQAG